MMQSWQTVEWSRDSVVLLINLYHSHPVLWDDTHVHYKDRAKKNDAWLHIADTLKMDKMETEKKMKILMAQFQRECKKMRMSDEGIGAHYRSKWFAFNSLSFLLNKFKYRKLQTGMQVEDDANSSENEDPHGQEKNQHTFEPKLQSELESEHSTDTMLDIGEKEDRTYFPYPKTMKIEKLTPKNKRVLMGEEIYQEMGSVQDRASRDEFQIFGELVACKLRKLSTPYATSTTQHHINNILYRAELGEYNNPPKLQSQELYLHTPLPSRPCPSGGCPSTSQNEDDDVNVLKDV